MMNDPPDYDPHSEDGYPRFCADMEDWTRHWLPLVDAIVDGWRREGWRIPEDTLRELAFEAIHVVGEWLPTVPPPPQVAWRFFVDAVDLKNRWKRRAIAAGYRPPPLTEDVTRPVNET